MLSFAKIFFNSTTRIRVKNIIKNAHIFFLSFSFIVVFLIAWHNKIHLTMLFNEKTLQFLSAETVITFWTSLKKETIKKKKTKTFSPTFFTDAYSVKVKSKISFACPLNSRTLSPVRLSHNRRIPSKHAVKMKCCIHDALTTPSFTITQFKNWTRKKIENVYRVF